MFYSSSRCAHPTSELKSSRSEPSPTYRSLITQLSDATGSYRTCQQSTIITSMSTAMLALRAKSDLAYLRMRAAADTDHSSTFTNKQSLSEKTRPLRWYALVISATALILTTHVDLPNELLREIAKSIRDGKTVVNFALLHWRSYDMMWDVVHESVTIRLWKPTQQVRDAFL